MGSAKSEVWSTMSEVLLAILEVWPAEVSGVYIQIRGEDGHVRGVVGLDRGAGSAKSEVWSAKVIGVVSQVRGIVGRVRGLGSAKKEVFGQDRWMCGRPSQRCG